MKEHPRTTLGIIGAGGIASSIHAPVLKTLEGADVAWICDVRPERAKELAAEFPRAKAFTRLEDCSDVNGVLVAIPVGYRDAVMPQVFARKWNAICEKPFAPSLVIHDRLVAGARQAGTVLNVGLMRRFYGTTLLARRLLAPRPFGKILEVFGGEGGHLRSTGHGGGWYQEDAKAAGGGVFLETGSHLVDQVALIAGVSAVSVGNVVSEGSDGIDDHTDVTGEFTTESGEDVAFRFVISRLHDVPYGIRVRCEHATLMIGPGAADTIRLVGHSGETLCQLAAKPGDGALLPVQAFHLEWQDFLTACAGGETRLAADSSRLSMQVIDGAYSSIRTAQTPRGR